MSLSTDGDRLTISYSVQFEMDINNDVTHETYAQWESEGNYVFVALTFATEAYEGDGGSYMSYSIEDDE